MSLRRSTIGFGRVAKKFFHQPHLTGALVQSVQYLQRGYQYASDWTRDQRPTPIATAEPAPNPLRDFVRAKVEGAGVWKWDHYHDIYHRHLERFRGKEVHLMEVGIYSGGSLEMWREYFGDGCRIYGVDIEEACRSYENEWTRVFIGDQEDRSFWRDVKRRVPRVDVLIDDGGHQAGQQIVTCEEMLPHLSPGGVFLCEDILGEHEGFAAFAQAVASNLHHIGEGAAAGMDATPLQANLASVHTYPLMTVFEKHAQPVDRLIALRHGTQWQPFLGAEAQGHTAPG